MVAHLVLVYLLPVLSDRRLVFAQGIRGLLQLLLVMHGISLLLKDLRIPVVMPKRCLRLVVELGQEAGEFVIGRHLVSYPIEIAEKRNHFLI